MTTYKAGIISIPSIQMRKLRGIQELTLPNERTDSTVSRVEDRLEFKTISLDTMCLKPVYKNECFSSILCYAYIYT